MNIENKKLFRKQVCGQKTKLSVYQMQLESSLPTRQFEDHICELDHPVSSQKPIIV